MKKVVKRKTKFRPCQRTKKKDVEHKSNGAIYCN